MRRKKTKKSVNNFNKADLIKGGLVLAAILVLIGIGYFIRSMRQEKVKFKTETSRSIQRSLPAEVKKRVELASPSASMRVPILMYHYVEYVQDKNDTIRQSLNINPFIFEEQIKTLKNAGYTFMTARELGDVLDGKRLLPSNPLLLTFDDGHWDFSTDILPILKKYNVKATQYVIPGFTGGSDFMTQKQVQEAIDSGIVDIGAHTVHHVSLKGHFLKTVEFEVKESKKMLEDTYHIQVVSFAYPNGSFDEQAEKVVKEAGFTTSVSTVPGIQQSQTNRFFLYRLRPGRRIGQELLNWLKQDKFAAY
ncbi:polysaccharide deacetylase family protein [Candidatus Roizmanbacteria bacterium]|nr:polysaccharide deacetylase family protein [Candidatus Roizmanbacteria bacterium]